MANVMANLEGGYLTPSYGGLKPGSATVSVTPNGPSPSDIESCETSVSTSEGGTTVTWQVGWKLGEGL